MRAPWRTSQRPVAWLRPRPPELSSLGAKMPLTGRRLVATMTPADLSAVDVEYLCMKTAHITINMTTLQVLVTPMPTKITTSDGVVVVVVDDVLVIVVLVIVRVKVVVVVCVLVLDEVVVVLVVDVVLVLVGSIMMAVIGLWNSPCAHGGVSLRGMLVLR